MIRIYPIYLYSTLYTMRVSDEKSDSDAGRDSRKNVEKDNYFLFTQFVVRELNLAQADLGVST